MQRRRISGWALAACIGVLLVAWWLRVEQINHYPPGVSNDEGVDVIDVFHIARSGVLPFYEDLGRPEPMYLVIQAAATHFFGAGVPTLRITTALLGVLNIAAAYWAALQCCRDMPRGLRHMAALAAALALAVAVGHVTLSRAIYRAILQPLFMFLLVGWTLRALRTESRRDFCVAGLLLGGLLYTYTAAYVVPLMFGFLGVFLVALRWRRWLPRLMLMAITAGILFSPVVIRYLEAPQAVFGRATDVSGGAGWSIVQLPQIIIDLYFGVGDQNPQYNVARAPLVPPLLQPLCILGVLALVWRWRHPAGVMLAALTLLVTLPVLLTPEIPHGLRIVGAYAVFPLLVSLGLALLWRLLCMVMQERLLLALVGSGLLLVLGTQAWQAHTIYAAYWAQPDAYRMWDVFGQRLNHNEWFFRVDRRALADWLKAQPYPILLPLDEVLNITTRAWLLPEYDQMAGTAAKMMLPAQTHIFLPYALADNDVLRDARQFVLLHEGTLTLLPALEPATVKRMVAVAEMGQRVTGGDGRLDFLGYFAPWPETDLTLNVETVQPVIGDKLAFGAEIQLDGWQGEHLRLTEGSETVGLTLLWRALRPLGHDYWSFVQVLTQDYERVAGSRDAPMLRWLMPTTQWTHEDHVPVPYELALPALEPGAYRLVAGVYAPFADRLPASNAAGQRFENGVAMVSWLKVPLPVVNLPEVGALADTLIWDETFQLLYSRVETREGQTRVQLYWMAHKDRPAMDATIFVHGVDANGVIVAQQDTRPRGGQYPTFIWDAGEIVLTEHVLNAAPEVIRVGLYVFDPTVRNLPLKINGEEQAQPFVVLPPSSQ